MVTNENARAIESRGEQHAGSHGIMRDFEGQSFGETTASCYRFLSAEGES